MIRFFQPPWFVTHEPQFTQSQRLTQWTLRTVSNLLLHQFYNLPNRLYSIFFLIFMIRNVPYRETLLRTSKTVCRRGA
jgi:hypothetical protein